MAARRWRWGRWRRGGGGGAGGGAAVAVGRWRRGRAVAARLRGERQWLGQVAARRWRWGRWRRGGGGLDLRGRKRRAASRADLRGEQGFGEAPVRYLRGAQTTRREPRDLHGEQDSAGRRSGICAGRKRRASCRLICVVSKDSAGRRSGVCAGRKRRAARWRHHSSLGRDCGGPATCQAVTGAFTCLAR